MPLTAAAGGISRAEHLLAFTLAKCTQWQEDLDVSTAEQALTHIHFDALPVPKNAHSYSKEEYQALRPWAIVSTHPLQRGYRLSHIAADSWFNDSGLLSLNLEYNLPAELKRDPAEHMRQFKNRIGKILRKSDSDPEDFVGLCDLAHGYHATEQYCAIREIELVLLGRGKEKFEVTEGDFLMVEFLISWGTPGA